MNSGEDDSRDKVDAQTQLVPPASTGQDSHPPARKRVRRTAVDYVARLDLPPIVREPLDELASRFDERLFLPTIGDVRNFLLFCDYDGKPPKARGTAVPCVFRLLARMDPARVAGIRDERMFSGPANMLPIADAIGQASSGVQPSGMIIRREILLVPGSGLNGLRDALIHHAKEPWTHARARSSQVDARVAGDTLVFRRRPANDIPESEVVLNARDAGYRLSNIVAVIHGDRRDVAAWNSVLEDFISCVAAPATNKTRHKLIVGPNHVAMRDLASLDAERSLRRFSAAANRSTGSDHPLDERRWIEFVIACARAVGRQDRQPLTPTLDGKLLCRWLTEVDGWTGDLADDLVRQYEFGLELVQAYDQSRPYAGATDVRRV